MKQKEAFVELADWVREQAVSYRAQISPLDSIATQFSKRIQVDLELASISPEAVAMEWTTFRRSWLSTTNT